MNSDTETPRRPRDLAVLLLAIGGDSPRARARDQQADLAGASIRRDVLDRLAAIDPEPDGLEGALSAIVDQLGEPTGPTRGVASTILQDWQFACIGPEFWSWLVAEAVYASSRAKGRRDGLA